MIMNIGIITFHNAVNYGAVLQCYALKEYLKIHGGNVYVVNYCNKDLLSCYKAFDRHRFIRREKPLIMVRRLFSELSLITSRIKRNYKFHKFVVGQLNLLEPTIENINKLDLIVIGSDQVWNTKLTRGFDDYYWGNFCHSEKTRLISYAASIEEFWDAKEDHVAKHLLAAFDSISVREAKAVHRISDLLPENNINLSVDPTLLIDKGIWGKIAKKPSVKEPYLLVYQVRPSEKVCKIAEVVAEQLSLKIVYLSADVAGLNSSCCRSASPEEYLGLFKYASFVVCSSFHGTVFSLIFSKPFISVKLNDGKDSRVETLLMQFNAQHRFLSDYKDIYKLKDLMEIIEYSSSVSESSKKYLLNYLCKNEDIIYT